MVISHQHCYVFIQTMKTAPTAIAAELCENYDGEMILHKHATLEEFHAQASADEKTYLSFAGVRNPLDVAVSRFALRRSGKRNADPKQQEQTRFIRETGEDFGPYFRKYGILRREGGAEIGIVPLHWHTRSFQSTDHIYRYENLQEEFSTILKKIGVDQLRELPLGNPTAGKTDFMSYYDSETLALAYRTYFPYLDHWGYEVPPGIRFKAVWVWRMTRLRGSLRRLIDRLRPARG